MTVFAAIRAAAAEVADQAEFVRIDPAAVERCAREYADVPVGAAPPDPAHHHLATEEETLAYIVTLDAINFGSGWFPFLRKRPGLSGYFTVATSLKEHFEREGPFSASALRALDADAVTAILGQRDAGPEAQALMEHFARALRHLGTFLEQRHAGRFEALLASAQGSAAQLVDALQVMPYYRDVSRYGDLDVPLYKRAQLTAADLASAFGGEGPGRFEDLEELTMFADNLVPHVLRCSGVLVYDAALAARIDGGEHLQGGSREEIEIRAVGLHAVERLVEALRAAGRGEVSAQWLDSQLWRRGQAPEIKAVPRHRARSVFY